MMMETEIEKNFRIEDLAVGKIFDKGELIIYLEHGEMMTLIRELNYLDHEGESQISRRHYNFYLDNDGTIKKIVYNGFNEFSTEEEAHKEYDKMLKIKGL
ncbi:MAG: hypothetical protein Q8P15_01795 [Nanoarchaeota archaeon]|nr:hypothetical protein [Nanoarchaeota archaeon]